MLNDSIINAQKCVKKAEKNFQAGNIDEAIRLLTKSLRIYKLPEAENLLRQLMGGVGGEDEPEQTEQPANVSNGSNDFPDRSPDTEVPIVRRKVPPVPDVSYLGMPTGPTEPGTDPTQAQPFYDDVPYIPIRKESKSSSSQNNNTLASGSNNSKSSSTTNPISDDMKNRANSLPSRNFNNSNMPNNQDFSYLDKKSKSAQGSKQVLTDDDGLEYDDVYEPENDEEIRVEVDNENEKEPSNGPNPGKEQKEENLNLSKEPEKPLSRESNTPSPEPNLNPAISKIIKINKRSLDYYYQVLNIDIYDIESNNPPLIENFNGDKSSIQPTTHNLSKNLPHNDKKFKKEYRKLSLKVHPDKNDNSDEAQLAFDIISKAYNTLTDEKLKEEYDFKILNQNNVPDEEELQKIEKENNIKTTENFTRQDGKVYSGEINMMGQAHGQGDMLFLPNPTFDENGDLVKIDISKLDEKDESIKRDVKRDEAFYLTKDSIVNRRITTVFQEDQITDKKLRIDFILPNATVSDPNYAYQGEFKTLGRNILRHGQGKMTWSNSSSYIGLWKNDLMHDESLSSDVKSKFSSKFGGISLDYIGNFKNGMRFGHGFERVVHKNEKNENQVTKSTYVGEFVNNLYHGFGHACREVETKTITVEMVNQPAAPRSPVAPTRETSSSSIATGSSNNKMNTLLSMGRKGFTSMRDKRAAPSPPKIEIENKPQTSKTTTKTTVTRHEYSGQFKSGQYCGFGRLTSSDGTICEGTWQNGQLHGQNISYFKPGVGTFIGEFINGRRGQGIVKQL